MMTEKERKEKENKIIMDAKELKKHHWTKSAIIQHCVATYNEKYGYIKSLVDRL
jgi:hypothetical protein